jgi:hypothetical protein
MANKHLVEQQKDLQDAIRTAEVQQMEKDIAARESHEQIRRLAQQVEDLEWKASVAEKVAASNVT